MTPAGITLQPRADRPTRLDAAARTAPARRGAIPRLERH